MEKRTQLLKLAKQATKILKNDYYVSKVYLIGSLSKGIVHDKSDIDIVVERLTPNLYIKALTQIYDILPTGVELNLIPFEDAFESLKNKTIKEGVKLYG